MLKGIIAFRARRLEPRKGVTFPLVDFEPQEASVDKVEIEAASNGDEINSTVYLSGVAELVSLSQKKFRQRR